MGDQKRSKDGPLSLGRTSNKESEDDVEAWKDETTGPDIEIKQGFTGEDVSILEKRRGSRRVSMSGSNMS